MVNALGIEWDLLMEMFFLFLYNIMVLWYVYIYIIYYIIIIDIQNDEF